MVSEIRLRNVEKNPNSEDSRLIWIWRNDPHTRQMSLSIDPISWGEHHLWYERAGKNPKRKLWIIESKSDEKWIACGVIRLDMEDDQSSYLGLNIDPNWRHLGIGRASLEKIKTLAISMNLKKIDALIKGTNKASIHLFESVGFILLEDRSLHERTLKHYRWIL